MNMQAIMKQAQKLQKDMLEAQNEINNKVFESKSSLVSVKMTGAKKLVEVKITADTIENDDIEMLEDMIMVAVNDTLKQIEKETEEKLGKYTQGMPGLF